MFLQSLTYQKLLLRLEVLQEKSSKGPLSKLQVLQFSQLKVVEKDEACALCGQKLTKKFQNISIPCDHHFHAKCVADRIKKRRFVCPECKQTHGEKQPPQPPGTFKKSRIKQVCAGYEDVDTIQIEYDIPGGIQNGQHYHGTNKKCYLPNNKEGQELAELLEKAFDQGLIFTIGRSLQTGQANSVIFNDIHHKTSLKGGQFGYPDKGYLDRVRQELADIGIK